jgi:hypothetical protein
MNLAGQAAWVLGATDETSIHTEGLGDREKTDEDVRRWSMEPCVETFASRPKDGSKAPSHALAQPTDDCQRIKRMAGKLIRYGGFDAVEPIEVENGVGSRKNTGGSTGNRVPSPDGRRGHGADEIGGCRPVLTSPPPPRVLGTATVVNFACPDDIEGPEQGGNKMSGARLHEIAVYALRGVLPYIYRSPCKAADEIASVDSGGIGQATGCDFPPLLDGLLFSQSPASLWVEMEFGADSNEGHDPLPVVAVSTLSSACEAFIGKDDEVIAGAVATRLGTGGTAGGDLAGGVIPDFFEQGGVDGHFPGQLSEGCQTVIPDALTPSKEIYVKSPGRMAHQRRLSSRIDSRWPGCFFANLPR